MKGKAKNFFANILVYIAGFLIGAIFHLFVILGKIKIFHWDRFPKRKTKIIVISNHPSLLEPLLLPGLFFSQYAFDYFKFAPWSTPDKENFYDKWCWAWIRARSIPIPRNDMFGSSRTLVLMKKILDSEEGIIIYFPEGGRTFKGTEFSFSKKGRRIKKLKNGIGWLALRTQALILPVWVEGTEYVLPNTIWRDDDVNYFPFPRLGENIVIKIGDPFIINGKNVLTKEKATDIITEVLLELADEEE